MAKHKTSEEKLLHEWSNRNGQIPMFDRAKEVAIFDYKQFLHVCDEIALSIAPRLLVQFWALLLQVSEETLQRFELGLYNQARDRWTIALDEIMQLINQCPERIPKLELASPAGGRQ